METASKTDIDQQETQEWLDALETVLQQDGAERAHFLLEKLIEQARRSGAYLPFSNNTAYVNTIPPHHEPRSPGDQVIEKRIRAIIRWNALAMVVFANRKSAELGGHISSFASSASLYDVGFNHFFHAPTEDHGGDLIYIQGHSAPGIYARAFLEGRISESQIKAFRQEVAGGGLSSYPHPWLMPDFWQFPTVSMGLGPISAIYQARFMKYLHNRDIVDTHQRKVWCFTGDGEMDEPESLGAISLAGREKLDNLVMVVNCNLQRLDGPVRGNGKIIQELEASFRGAGWAVIKVIWGSYWDTLLAKDQTGLLRERMNEVVDGEYQNYKAKGGAYIRKHFFGKYPELLRLVSNMSDDDIWRLNRGGHDPHKIYAAYESAMNTEGKPTVILAKTVKGYALGPGFEAQNATHSKKKMADDAMRQLRDQFSIPLTDDQLDTDPFYKPDENSPEMKYMRERRAALGGYLPARRREAESHTIPPLSSFDPLLKGSGDREMSTTMAFVRALTVLLRDKDMGKYVVPIVSDEARTFGMDSMFRQFGIYSAEGQLYDPMDSDQLLYYREDKAGQMLEEGITEAGATASWIAAGTAYSNHGKAMIPFYIFYSMFGFQRVGDLLWSAGDSRAKGFLLGATSGKTTLAGEGLQHQDGTSLLTASAIPNCVCYDPTFAYELAVIMHDGLRRMIKENENIFYYLTITNENYLQPALPEKSVEQGILKGMYWLASHEVGDTRVQLLGSGAILLEVIAAAEILANDYAISSDIWSATSIGELAREGRNVERNNLLNPDKATETPYVTQLLADHDGPVIAATDHVRAYTEQLRPYIDRPYRVLGTDGFGRSDTRKALRGFFEVDRHFIVLAALTELMDEGKVEQSIVLAARDKFAIDPAKPNPMSE